MGLETFGLPFSPKPKKPVIFRKHSLLPLDDCLYALKNDIPVLFRSSLYRYFQPHGISRLPIQATPKPIGLTHIVYFNSQWEASL